MNIVAILANGVGARFGSNIPKQFHKINGKMIIEYVVEAISTAKSVDKIVVVTNVEANKGFLSGLLQNEKVVLTDGGSTRNLSLKNALEFVNSTFDCQKLIVCDAVRPMITGELIDKYFALLDNSTAVVTAQKITDSLGCYDIKQVYRDRYYLMQSPEGFDFKTLYASFDENSKLTEVTQQLPENSKIELYFEFNNNFKLTYPADLKYLEALINARDNKVDQSAIFDGVTRLNRYLFENYPSQTKQWRRVLECEIPNVLKKWQITDYHIIKTSHFGIIFLAKSVKYGDCVLKIIPPFINRYLPEKNCYRSLPSSLMCEMYDYDDNCSALLLKQLSSDIDEKDIESSNVFDFFKNAFAAYSKFNNSSLTFHDYSSELKAKLNETDFEYRKGEIMAYVQKAVDLFEKQFSQDDFVLIHGDLHRYNIMKDDSFIFAIDPIGYVAPPEIDIARFIGTELTDRAGDKAQILDDFLDYFAPLSTKERLFAALFVDIVFRMHNSIFENDSFELTDKWLNILDNLFSE